MKRDSFEWGTRRVGLLLQLAAAFALSGAACGSTSNGSPGFGNGSSGGTSSSGGKSSSGGASSSSGSGNNGGTSSGSGDNGGVSSGGGGTSSGGTSGGGTSGGGGGDDGGPADNGDAGHGSNDGGGGTTTHGACLDGITDYENPGPFMYTAQVSGSVKMWIPTVPAGCKVPVIHLSNGTGATCADYQDDLNRMASHGFLATCFEDTNTGAGTDGMTAFETAMMMYPALADNKLGSTGHSQGGQAAFTTLQLAEAKWGTTMIYAGLAMEPASGFGTQPSGGTWQMIYGEIKSPMFMFSGTADMLVSAAWVGQAYSAMNPKNEVYWWSATGATHIPTPQVPEEQVSIPWFRWKLLGDNAACKFFKAIPGNSMINPGWTKQMSENEAPCQ
jgi:hypothetical protein